MTYVDERHARELAAKEAADAIAAQADAFEYVKRWIAYAYENGSPSAMRGGYARLARLVGMEA